MHEIRQHHYGFAHGILARMSAEMGSRLLDDPPPRGYDAALAAIWDGYGATLPAETRLDHTGLAGELVDRAGHRMLVVTLPPPVAPAEAYLAAIVRPPGAEQCRYFTLEHTVSPVDGAEGAVLGGWSDGSHLNYGSCDGPPTADVFVAAILRKSVGN